jgi:hypothetical protein
MFIEELAGDDEALALIGAYEAESGLSVIDNKGIVSIEDIGVTVAHGSGADRVGKLLNPNSKRHIAHPDVAGA